METVEVDKLEGQALDAVVQVRIFGGTCARCQEPGSHIVNGVIYCSPDCEERIGDFALEDYEETRARYSTDIAAAWLIVESISQRRPVAFQMHADIDGETGQAGYCCVFDPTSEGPCAGVFAPAAPEAICRAALKALQP